MPASCICNFGDELLKQSAIWHSATLSKNDTVSTKHSWQTYYLLSIVWTYNICAQKAALAISTTENCVQFASTCLQIDLCSGSSVPARTHKFILTCPYIEICMLRAVGSAYSPNEHSWKLSAELGLFCGTSSSRFSGNPRMSPAFDRP